MTAPRATERGFRGPEASRTVTSVTPQARTRSQTQLRTWVQQSNRATIARPGRDAMGRTLATGGRHLDVTRTNPNFGRVEGVLGRPTHEFQFTPRGGRGHEFGRDHDEFGDRDHHRDHDHDFVDFDFFFPFYFADPFFYGFDYPGYYPSIYSYWGWCPGWIYPNQVYYDPTDAIYDPQPYLNTDSPYRYYQSGVRLDSGGADRAISELRRAWMDGDPNLFSAHLSDDVDIRVYFDGNYSYTTSTKNFYAMTADALNTTKTVSIDFDDPVWISAAEVFYTGRQVFTDPDGGDHTVYLSYRLRHLGSDWYIVGVGSSEHPIQSHYTDYRNR